MRARLVSLVLVLSVASVEGAARGDLRLVNNGYEGLVVTITDHVPQQHCNHVVQGLKVRRLVPVPLSHKTVIKGNMSHSDTHCGALPLQHFLTESPFLSEYKTSSRDKHS